MTKHLQVLHVGKYYPPYMGGIESHLETLCEALRPDVEVSVLVANSESFDTEELVGGIPVTRVGTKLKVGTAPLCPGMVSRLRASTADIIHVHLPNPTAVLAYLASGHKGPLVVTYHSDTVKQALLGAMFEPILNRFLRQSTAIIVSSPNYLRTSATLAEHQSRCRVVPLGIPVEQFGTCSPTAVERVRGKFGNRLVLAVGRMVYYKGFEYLIEAMTRVQGHLLLVGEGPLRPELQRLVASRGLSERVSFLGVVADLVPFYHAADVFVLPSIARSEAFGIVQIEAMAAGTPVVNTSLDSGVPFVSPHGTTGLTVQPKDSVALAGAIGSLLDDDQLRAACSKAAQFRARSEFSAEKMRERTQAIYEECAGRRSPGATDDDRRYRQAV